MNPGNHGKRGLTSSVFAVLLFVLRWLLRCNAQEFGEYSLQCAKMAGFVVSVSFSF